MKSPVRVLGFVTAGSLPFATVLRGKRELSLLLAALSGVSACGGDGHASSGGDAAAGTLDGGAGAGGRSTAGGGGRSTVGGGGGTAAGGSALGGGGPDGSFASCTKLSDLPPLPKETVTAASTCSMPTTCGGDIAGRWAASEACIDDSTLFPQLLGVCSTATFSITSSNVKGTVAIENGRLKQDVTYDVEATARLPNDCAFCDCATKETELRSAGIDATCFQNCPDCTCVLHTTVTSATDATFTMNGSTLSTNDGHSFETCASAGELFLRETGGAAPVMTLVPEVVGPTPERCDGRDNDGDGIVDDDPVDCPSCDPDGVCAGAARAVCSNGAWQCTYTAPAYEPTETLCDHLDNDCNGQIDEGPLCGPELCDGVDNDANGLIDDSPTDTPPPCSTLGVCSAGGSPVCKNGAWTCKYLSPAWESTETLCDKLDNDCNGQVDEPLACCIPKKCADVGAECGKIDNGCKATTDCGGCTGNAWCGAAAPNKCACIPSVSEPAHSPAAGSNDASIGNVAWNNTTAIFATDWDGDPLYNHGVAFVSAMIQGETSNYLVASGFGFALPPAAVVKGVTVTVNRRASSPDGLVDQAVRLVTTAGIGTTDRALGSFWAASAELSTYGGPTDTWGGGLTPAIVNSPDFGVALSARYTPTAGNSWAYVDQVTVAIAYTVSCP